MNVVARRFAVLLVVAVIAAAVLLPSTVMAALRRQIPWFSQVLSWLDHVMPSVDLVHLICFGALTVCTVFAWPRVSWRLKVGGLLGFAALSEMVQIWVPGRRPSGADFVDDLTGMALGLFLWALLRGLTRMAPQRGKAMAPVTNAPMPKPGLKVQDARYIQPDRGAERTGSSVI